MEPLISFEKVNDELCLYVYDVKIVDINKKLIEEVQKRNSKYYAKLMSNEHILQEGIFEEGIFTYGIQFLETEGKHKEHYYLGELHNNWRHGYGILKKDKYSFEGNWNYDEYTDDDYIIHYSLGDYYKGQVNEYGERDGQGFYKTLSGCIYNGEWKNNETKGYGEYTDIKGNTYKGFWKDSKFHGEGTYIYNDGRSYKGSFEYDLKHGYGDYEWANGEKYMGNWKRGKRNGNGTKITIDNITKNVVFKNGKKVSEEILS